MNALPDEEGNQPKDKRVGKFGMVVTPTNPQGGPKELHLRVDSQVLREEWLQVLAGGASGAVLVKPREERRSGSAAMSLFSNGGETST